MATNTDRVQSLQRFLTILIAISYIRESVSEECKRNYTALEGWVTSPFYPNNYTDNMNCFYFITQPDGYRITLHFWDFHLEPEISCSFDFVVIYDGDSLNSPVLKNSPMLKFCDTALPSVLRTTGNAALIWFHSDENVTDKGFNVSYATAVVPKEFLLLAENIGLIYRFDLEIMSHIIVPVKDVFSVTAIDYDPVDDRIYWTDTALKEIHSAFLNGSDNRLVHYLGPGITSGTQYGIRLDTQSRLIFYTDAGNQIIGVLTMTTFEQKLLITTDLDKPRAIVLDIMNGIMFWTDWGATPKIERANYDATDRRVLVSTRIIKPDGLALDTAKNRVYWVDSGMDRLEYMTMDGMNRITLIVFHYNPVYLGLALHNNLLYVTYVTNESSTVASNVFRINTTDTNITNIIEGKTLTTEIIIYSSVTSIAGSNGCTNGNGGCSHICIPSGGHSTKCLCPNGRYLSDDQKTCLSPGPNGCTKGQGGCSHICIPSGGNSTQCLCPSGQYLLDDQMTCSSKGTVTSLIGGTAGGGLILILLIIAIIVCVKRRRADMVSDGYLYPQNTLQPSSDHYDDTESGYFQPI